MIKQLNMFVLTLLTFFWFSGYAFSGIETSEPPSSAAASEFQCNFQAPINLHAVETGTDYVILTWSNPGPPPPAHNLKVFDVATAALISDVTFPYTTPSRTASGLLPGRLYRFELRPVCVSGEVGPGATYVGSTLILELLVTNFTPSSSENTECTIGSNVDRCPFSTSGVSTFKIKSNTVSREFGIEKVAANRYKIKLLASNSNDISGFDFHANGIEEPDFLFGSWIAIDHQANDQNAFAKFRVVTDDSNQPFLKCDFINSGYNIVKYYGTTFAPSTDDRLNPDELQGSANDKIVATPNPFNDQLDLQVPFSTEENDVTVNLYDLQGRLVTSIKTPGGPQIRSLSTSFLLPGLYLLRVECGDRIETIKVMKTQ